MHPRDETSPPLPIGFVSHGAPTLALDQTKGRDLTAWAASMPTPRAILVVSAHWLRSPLSLGTTARRDLIYDFHGFPAELSQVRYNAPAAEDLAPRVRALLGGAEQQNDRGWDHGVWVPLVHMAPEADIPVLQLSLPARAGPRQIFDWGRKLAPLRREGVFILGSGGMTHNLRELNWSGDGTTPNWAEEFEDWARRAIENGDADSLIQFEDLAPGARLAHPTTEHYLPLLLAAGASEGQLDRVRFPVKGFEFGSLSRLAVQWG